LLFSATSACANNKIICNMVINNISNIRLDRISCEVVKQQMEEKVTECFIISGFCDMLMENRNALWSVYKFFILIMPDYHKNINLQSSRRAPVFHPKTSKTLFGPVFIFIFYLELYKNKFKNLIEKSQKPVVVIVL
jgi:hypothetical protein